ncbi:hypothetical protein B0H14DRAFT_2634157 [Mycena olivaceomarginata]|nr:hypothetical protein B0H14DRAFT_2634157 [Mycena olivaceomarginata]
MVIPIKEWEGPQHYHKWQYYHKWQLWSFANASGNAHIADACLPYMSHSAVMWAFPVDAMWEFPVACGHSLVTFQCDVGVPSPTTWELPVACGPWSIPQDIIITALPQCRHGLPELTGHSGVEDEVGRWVDQRGSGRAGRDGVEVEQMCDDPGI